MIAAGVSVANGCRIVLAPRSSRLDGSWIVIPGRAALRNPHLFVSQASLLFGAIKVTADGHRVTTLSILG